ncbi:hypothetical protein AVEN_38686-1 [Araneus ventricosus]|uniref:Uncharacterized protein n=1 Tax=Araneus ventricosus TaxID=182803 RepID=A0A4Y2T8H1_ARAVE|nr:hypothetical protein AVEN_38686-1 [Araneus ventricosus]
MCLSLRLCSSLKVAPSGRGNHLIDIPESSDPTIAASSPNEKKILFAGDRLTTSPKSVHSFMISSEKITPSAFPSKQKAAFHCNLTSLPLERSQSSG